MKGKAVLFGLNYKNKSIPLRGCVNDVTNMRHFLRAKEITCELYTDEKNPEKCTGREIMNTLTKVAKESREQDYDFVWIHYSGHGSYVIDKSSDEEDGRDECLVPNDYENGVIPDDYLRMLFKGFNPRTKVICVFDCCHSGTVGDVPYSWRTPVQVFHEHPEKLDRKIMTISGCLDSQVSLEVKTSNEYSGALTSCLLHHLKNSSGVNGDVFRLIELVRDDLKRKGFKQVPKLCSSYNLYRDKTLVF
jgi:hypothetical protein